MILFGEALTQDGVGITLGVLIIGITEDGITHTGGIGFGYIILIGVLIITVGDGDQDGEETHIGIIGDGTICTITIE